MQIFEDNIGTYITRSKNKIRIAFSNNRWIHAPTAPGFPQQLNYYKGEKASVIAYCNEGYTVTFAINHEKSLTMNLLDHFDPIDDGLLYDMTRIHSTGKSIFSINKITLIKTDSVKSIYFPAKKPGALKYYHELFDSAPLYFPDSNRILVSPDNYVSEMRYSQFPYDMHLMQQGSLDSCGHTCAAMVAKDLLRATGTGQRTVNFFVMKSKQKTGGIFLHKLSEEMRLRGIKNKFFHIIDPVTYVQDKMSQDYWSGIVSVGGHACVISKAGSNEFYIRDPYQGILYVDKLSNLKNYHLNEQFIEIY